MAAAAPTPPPPSPPAPMPTPVPTLGDSLDDLKKLAEISKINAERLKLHVSMMAGIGTTIGLLTVFFYCFFILRFFPSGLKLGDTLFFIFAMLGAGLTAPLLALLGTSAYVPWVNRTAGTDHAAWLVGFGVSATIAALTVRSAVMDLVLSHSDATVSFPWLATLGFICSAAVFVFGTVKVCLDKFDRLMSFAAGVVFVFVLGLSTVFVASWTMVLAFVSAVAMGGFAFVLGLDMLDGAEATTVAELKKNKRKQRSSAILLVAGMLVPLLMSGAQVQTGMLKFVMKSMGVYTEQATIIVSGRAYGKLRAASAANGIPLYSCQADAENTSISKVRILWHGIGDRSYVELANGATVTRVELDSDGVRKSENQVASSCIELRRGLYFDSDKSELNKKQLELSEPILHEFFKIKNVGDSLLIIGYADPTPRTVKGNLILSRDRACDIYRRLKDGYLNDTDYVQIDARGDMEGIEACDTKLDANRLRACEARNRRVELRLIGTNAAVAQVGAADATVVCKPETK